MSRPPSCLHLSRVPPYQIAPSWRHCPYRVALLPLRPCLTSTNPIFACPIPFAPTDDDNGPCVVLVENLDYRRMEEEGARPEMFLRCSHPSPPLSAAPPSNGHPGSPRCPCLPALLFPCRMPPCQLV